MLRTGKSMRTKSRPAVVRGWGWGVGPVQWGEAGETYGEGQGSPACCSSWSCRVGHDLVTEQLLTSHEFSNNSSSQEALFHLLWQQTNSLQLTLERTEEIIDSCPAGEDSTCVKQVEFLNSAQVSQPQKILRCQEGEVPVLSAWPSGQLSLNTYAVIIRTTVQV